MLTTNICHRKTVERGKKHKVDRGNSHNVVLPLLAFYSGNCRLGVCGIVGRKVDIGGSRQMPNGRSSLCAKPAKGNQNKA